jgi:hypothetical protein
MAFRIKLVKVFKKNLIKSTASNEEDCNNYWVEGRDQCQSLAKKYHFPSLAGKLWGEKISLDYEFKEPVNTSKARKTFTAGSRRRRSRRRRYTLRR